VCRAPGEVKGLPFPTRPSVFTGDSELRGDDRVDEFGLVAFGVPGLLTSCSSMSDDVVCCGCFEVVVSSLVLFDGGGLWLELENEGLFVDFGCGVVGDGMRSSVQLSACSAPGEAKRLPFPTVLSPVSAGDSCAISADSGLV